MSVGISGSSSKSKSNNTIDPKTWAAFNQSYQPALDALAQTNAAPYTGALGAGQDPLSLQAAGMATANAGTGQGALGQAIAGAQNAGNYTPQNVQAGTMPGSDLSGYMNPYQDQVINSGLDKLDMFRQRALVGNSQAAGPGAWGGSRHGVADSLTNEGFIDQAGSWLSNMLQGGYDRATGLAQGDIASNLQAQGMNQNAGLAGANLGLGAANSLAAFGGQQNAMGAADASLINQFGLQGQATAQNANQMAYDEWLRQQQVPFLQAGAYGSLAGVVPQTVDNKSSGSQVGAQASYTYSDYRLKQDFEHVGIDQQGIDWFDYTLKSSGQRERGVIAQQVQTILPNAVRADADGYLMVDYGALQ